jgi:hypothetical protein
MSTKKADYYNFLACLWDRRQRQCHVPCSTMPMPPTPHQTSPLLLSAQMTDSSLMASAQTTMARSRLYKKPCKDCAAKETGNGNKHLVLDVASLLTMKRKQDVGYYCNCGSRSFGMKDGDELKALWTCDMVLCMSCFNERENKMSGDRTAKRCCRRR